MTVKDVCVFVVVVPVVVEVAVTVMVVTVALVPVAVTLVTLAPVTPALAIRRGSGKSDRTRSCSAKRWWRGRHLPTLSHTGEYPKRDGLFSNSPVLGRAFVQDAVHGFPVDGHIPINAQFTADS